MLNSVSTALGNKAYQEGHRILNFWYHHVLLPDGSFHGEIDSRGNIHHQAYRGSILAARILWTYSRAYVKEFDSSEAYRERLEHLYQNFILHFWDTEYLGFYWDIGANNVRSNDLKHVYAQAFAIYGLAQYYQATGHQEALLFAQLTFQLIERHAFDPIDGGYFESFNRAWAKSNDDLLDPKGHRANEQESKSMNTHIHLLEAYTQLYRVWPNPTLKLSIQQLLDIISSRILNQETHHYDLFFAADWSKQSDVVSYGHDIEGSWLMTEAAEVIHDQVRLPLFQKTAVQMVDSVLAEGWDQDGGLFNEGRGTTIIDDHKDWWPQAEAVVGCVNAYQITGDSKYLAMAETIWSFIEHFIIAKEYGDWYWQVARDGTPNLEKPIVEPWKCPYHNTRACMEVWERLAHLEESNA